MAPGYEWLAKLQDIPSYRALRSTEFTYVEWRTENPFTGNLELELYDLRRDPYQLFNLLSTPYGRSHYQPLVQQMQQRLRQLETCKGASCQ